MERPAFFIHKGEKEMPEAAVTETTQAPMQGQHEQPAAQGIARPAVQGQAETQPQYVTRTEL